MHQAIESVLCQQFEDFELLILDSGPLVPELERYRSDPRVRLEVNRETPELIKDLCIYSWICNRWIPEAKGRFIAYLCDDDLFLPDFLKTFAAAIEPGIHCYWTGMEMQKTASDGTFIKTIGFMRPEDNPKTFCCNQLMLCQSKESAFATPWPEAKVTENHCDGTYMETLHAKHTFKSVSGIHAVHRRTPLSEYCGPG